MQHVQAILAMYASTRALIVLFDCWMACIHADLEHGDDNWHRTSSYRQKLVRSIEVACIITRLMADSISSGTRVIRGSNMSRVCSNQNIIQKKLYPAKLLSCTYSRATGDIGATQHPTPEDGWKS